MKNSCPENRVQFTGHFRRGLNFAPDWANKPVVAITLDLVREWATRWKKDLEARGKSAKSVNDALVAFQATWNHPWDSSRAKPTFPDNPFAEFDRFPLEKKSRFVPDSSAIDLILNCAVSEEIHLYLRILYETAARPSEPLKLTWKDVYFEGRALTLFTKKKRGGKNTPRRLLISEELTTVLQERYSKLPSSVFVFQQERKEKPIGLVTINKLYKKSCETASVKYFELYCWRHWRASKWAKEGKPLTEIQAKLGHEDATMTNNYLHELLGT